MSTTAHGYHCAPTPTPMTFKETARSETSLAEPTSGGGVVGSVANPPFGGVAPFRGSALHTYRKYMMGLVLSHSVAFLHIPVNYVWNVIHYKVSEQGTRSYYRHTISSATQIPLLHIPKTVIYSLPDPPAVSCTSLAPRLVRTDFEDTTVQKASFITVPHPVGQISCCLSKSGFFK